MTDNLNLYKLKNEAVIRNAIWSSLKQMLSCQIIIDNVLFYTQGIIFQIQTTHNLTHIHIHSIIWFISITITKKGLSLTLMV